MSAVTETEIFGSFLPFPTIKSITLETGGIEVREKNPHIDETTMADGSANPFGDPKYVEKSGQLKISVSVVVKDSLSFTESQFNSQWMNNETSKFVNVAIVQSTDAKLTDLMLKNADVGVAMGFPYGTVPWSKVMYDMPVVLNHQKYKMIQNDQIIINSLSSITEQTGDKISKFETYVNKHGDTVIEYPINFTFSVDQETPSHLAYFCIATLDFDLLAAEFDVTPADITDSVSSLQEISEISHIVAIDGGSNVSIQNKFFLKDGTPFDGPVHYHPESGWMAGAQHSDQPHPLLDLKKVPNTVVRDFRSGVQEEIDLSALYDAENEIDKIVNNLSITSYRRKEQKKKSYLYDCLSYSEPRGFANGVTGQCGILFSLDMHSIVKDNSTFPGLYKIGSNNLKSEFTTKSKIRELKLFQRRVKKTNNTNELGVKNNTSIPLHPDEPATQIGSFNDHGTKINITEQEIYFPDLPFSSAFDHIRTFTSKNVIYGGEHEYFIELEIEDGTIKYFADAIEILYNLLDELKIYYNDATKLSIYYDSNGEAYQKGNFNIYLNKFTEEWINKKKGEPKEPGTYQSIKIRLNMLVNIYKHLANLGNQTAPFKNKILNSIKPETGSPAGISKVIKLVEHTISKMNDLAGISSYNISNNGIGAKGSNQDITDKKGLQNKSKSQRSTFKVTIPLNSKVDPGGNLDVGYDYISETADVVKAPQARHWPETGLKIIDSATFLDRISDESAKYYDSSDFDFDVSNNRTELDTLGNTALSYLTPSRVRVGHQFENIILNDLAGGFISTAVKANFRKIMLKSIKYNLNNRNLLPEAEENDELQDVMLKESDNKDLLMELFSSPGVQITATSNAAVFESILGFISDDDVSDDGKNELAEEIGTLLKEEYNGRNQTPRKNPNSLFFNLLSVMSDDIKHKKPLEYYDFSKLVPKDKMAMTTVDYSSMNSDEHLYDKILKSYFGAPGNFVDQIKSSLEKLPNQLKSLLKESDPTSMTGTKGSGLFDSGIKDPKIYLHDYAPYWFHFENIAELQYLAGYEQSDHSVYINMPIWKTLDLDTYNDFPKSKILCRVKKYENKLLDIQRPELLELPIYNEYFILNLEE